MAKDSIAALREQYSSTNHVPTVKEEKMELATNSKVLLKFYGSIETFLLLCHHVLLELELITDPRKQIDRDLSSH